MAPLFGPLLQVILRTSLHGPKECKFYKFDNYSSNHKEVPWIDVINQLLPALICVAGSHEEGLEDEHEEWGD